MPFLKYLRTNLAVIAVIFCQDDSDARGYSQHTLSFAIPEEELALTGWDGRRVVLPGTYRLEFQGSGGAMPMATPLLTISKRMLVEPPLPPPFPSDTPRV